MPKSPKTTRAQLIDVACGYFSAWGYQGTTLLDIAHAVGIGPSAVYKHFTNKLELYRAVVQQLAAPFMQLLDTFEPDSNAVDFALKVFHYHIEHPELARLALQASINGGEHRRLLIELWYKPYYEKTAARMRASAALSAEALLIPSEFMAFNNIMLGYINLAGLHQDTLGVDPFAPVEVAAEAELLRRFGSTLLAHCAAQMIAVPKRVRSKRVEVDRLRKKSRP